MARKHALRRRKKRTAGCHPGLTYSIRAVVRDSEGGCDVLQLDNLEHVAGALQDNPKGLILLPWGKCYRER